MLIQVGRQGFDNRSFRVFIVSGPDQGVGPGQGVAGDAGTQLPGQVGEDLSRAAEAGQKQQVGSLRFLGGGKSGDKQKKVQDKQNPFFHGENSLISLHP
jgi:hypothetical protein